MLGRRQAIVVACTLLAVACEGSSTPDDRGGADVGGALTGEVLVSAAASLTDAFAEVESAFESLHPGLDVLLNVAGSSTLRTQILDGAPVDVYAPADTSDMNRVIEAGEVTNVPRVIARNHPRIAVPAGNPAGITGLGDFTLESLRLGLCAEGVPCGDLARRALARAGVVPSLDTEEPDVRALLTKIELGELDAGITYATDVAAARPAVDGVDIDPAFDESVDYPIAVMAGAPSPQAAAAFVAFVLSDRGRAILSRHGFAS